MRANPFRPLPESVVVGGADCPIDSDFRVCVALEIEATENENPDVAELLRLFYKGTIPGPVDEALERMLWFYRCAPEEGAQPGKAKGGRSYDFAIDADVLTASFLQTYNIDLSTDRVHWWTFRRLMLNLPAETPFMQRVQYRVADVKQMPAPQRKHWKKMQKLYALKKHTEKGLTVEERDAALREKMRRRYEEAQNAKKI